MDFKYVTVNIKIPLKVFPNSEYETLMDSLNITFSPCDELYPSNQSEINDEFKSIVEGLFPKVSEREVVTEEKPFVPLADIKYRRKLSLTTTFKRKSGSSHQHTAKNFASILEDTVSVPHQSPNSPE